MSAPEPFFRSLETRNLLSDRCGSLSFGHFPAALSFCTWGRSISPRPLSLPPLSRHQRQYASIRLLYPSSCDLGSAESQHRAGRGGRIYRLLTFIVGTPCLPHSRIPCRGTVTTSTVFCSPINRDMIKTAVSAVAVIDNSEWILVSFNRGRVEHGAVDDQGFGVRGGF